MLGLFYLPSVSSARFSEAPFLFSYRNKWLKRFLNAHKLAACSLHQLRHTNATLLMAKGLDAKSLMGHLGHTDLVTTDQYLGFISEKEEQAADTMASLFEPTL